MFSALTKRSGADSTHEPIAAVVMPDHIHFAARLQDTGLSSLMHSLKSFTSNKINHLSEETAPCGNRSITIVPLERKMS